MEKIFTILSISLALANIAILANARDPDLVTDFVIPPGINEDMITGKYFTYTALRAIQNISFSGLPAGTPIVHKVTMKEFTTLEGQGVSCDTIVYPPSAMHLPHMHPRAAEMMLVVEGTLHVGFVDTTNKLYTQTLNRLDLFVFPRGTVHFQANALNEKPSVAISMYGSGNAGTVSLAKAMFKSGIDSKVLAKALKADASTVAKLIKANVE